MKMSGYPGNVNYEYPTENSCEVGTRDDVNAGNNIQLGVCRSITRDPIAPGVYTRIKKRSLDPLYDNDSDMDDKSDADIEVGSIDKDSIMTSKCSGLPIVQEFILDSQFSITIEGRRLDYLKVFVFLLLSSLTLGVFYVISGWFPSFRCFCLTRRSTLHGCTHIFVRNSFGNSEFKKVKSSHCGPGLVSIFESQSVHEHIVIFEEENKRNHRSSINKVTPYPPPANISKKMKKSKEDDRMNDDGGMIVSGHVDNQCIVPMESFVKDEYLHYFTYQCVRFIYHPLKGRYFESNQLEPIYNAPESILVQGLTTEISKQRSMAYGPNSVNVKQKGLVGIVISEILHPFNLFQILSMTLWYLDHYYVYACVILLIMIVSVSFEAYETKRNLGNLHNMGHFKFMVNVLRNREWKVISSEDMVPGDVFEISDTFSNIFPCDALLIEGDVIMNESMLTGESTSVPKSPLEKGEFNSLIRKKFLTNVNDKGMYEKSTIYGGTRIIRARSLENTAGRKTIGISIRTGFDTTRGALIRSILFPRPTNFKFYRDSMKFVLFLFGLSIAGFISTVYGMAILGVDMGTIILRATDLITIVVPPALPAAVTIGVTFAINRLKKRKIYCISPSRVNVCGKLDLWCFDKTGTLTEDGLDVLGVYVMESTINGGLSCCIEKVDMQGNIIDEVNEILDHGEQPGSLKSLMILGMSTCHSLRCIGESIIGDPLDVKMLGFTGWVLDDTGNAKSCAGPGNNRLICITVKPPPATLTPVLETTENNEYNKVDVEDGYSNEFGIIRCFEFSSALRRMSVLVKAFKGSGMIAFVKGSPEGIKNICVPSSLPHNFDSTVHKYAVKGYRILALGLKLYNKLTWFKAQRLKRQDIEKDIIFCGFIIFENKLKEISIMVIEKLKEANIKSVMCTGDNVLTAISISRDCGIVDRTWDVFVPTFKTDADFIPSNYEEHLVWKSVDGDSTLSPHTLTPTKHDEIQAYAIACTGDVLEYIIDSCSEDLFLKVISTCCMFARMSPNQKQRLVECLQKIGYTVGFCGDGANDCGALKSADVGLSLSDTEASIAAPFTCKIPNIQCVLDLICEGRSSLITSFSCLRFMTLYSIIQFTTVSLLYLHLGNMSDGQFVYIDLVLIFPLAVMMGRFKANQHISSEPPTSDLLCAKTLYSIFSQIAIQMCFQIVLYRLYGSYVERSIIEDRIRSPRSSMVIKNEFGTLVFVFSIFQYLIVAFIFSMNSPYQVSLFKNFSFISLIVGLLALNTIVLSGCSAFLQTVLNLTEVKPRYTILLLILLNYFCSLSAHLYGLRTLALVKRAWKKIPGGVRVGLKVF